MFKKTVGLCLIMVLTACFGGYSPDSSFYRLTPLSEPNQVFLASKSIAVTKVGLPEYLDRPQMIMLDDNSPKIEIAEFNRWGEDLSNMIQRKIVADLSKYLPKSKIINAAEEFQPTALNVKIEIIRMDMTKQGQAILEARWYIDNNSGKVLDSGKFTQSSDIKPTYADYAAAASNLLSEMSLVIAQALSHI